MGPREVYYSRYEAIMRVGDLLDSGRTVTVRKDIDGGEKIWVVEYK